MILNHVKYAPQKLIALTSWKLFIC